MTHIKYLGKAFNTQRNIFCHKIMPTIKDKINETQKILCGSFHQSQKYVK
jgi:hypothetical protein